MKHLLAFSLFEAGAPGLTPDQEEFLNRCTTSPWQMHPQTGWGKKNLPSKRTKGSWHLNPETGLVDVDGDFNCEPGEKIKNKLYKLTQGYVKRIDDKLLLTNLKGISFGHVKGNFYCSYNRLTSLAGAPQTVDGDFVCSHNLLTTLAGAPQTVDGSFYCDNNLLTSLVGAPQTVGIGVSKYVQIEPVRTYLTAKTGFICSNNKLTSLVGAPQTVYESFYCDNNQLTSLVGAPQTVDRGFYCHYNRLMSLEGAPQTVDGDFTCDHNRLTTLVGAPRKVGGSFSCANLPGNPYEFYNQLTSLAGAPQTVGGGFSCNLNQLTSLVGAPQTVGGGFSCDLNRLTNLVGAPKACEGFSCGKNPLTSLVGAPQIINPGSFCYDFEIKNKNPGERQNPDADVYFFYPIGLTRFPQVILKWNPKGWLKILTDGEPSDQKLILTLPFFDSDFWLQRLSGDLKKDGQVLLQLAALWEEPGWTEHRREIEQRLSPEQLRAIKALRTKLVYVNPWQGGVLTDLGDI